MTTSSASPPLHQAGFVSEKAVLLDELAKVVQAGDIVEGRVGSLMNWGAFIECNTGGWVGWRVCGEGGGEG